MKTKWAVAAAVVIGLAMTCATSALPDDDPSGTPGFSAGPMSPTAQRFTFINKDGKELPIDAQRILPFHDSVAAIKQDGKWGYVDTNGKFVIKPQFDDARSFNEGLAPVRKGTKIGIIDKSGKFVVKPKFVNAGDFKDGLCPVNLDGKWGYIERNGAIVIAAEFDEAANFSEDLAAVRKDGKFGFIDRKGKLVVKNDYDWASGFYDGFASVSKLTDATAPAPASEQSQNR